MASEMVERLAKKHNPEFGDEPNDDFYSLQAARWWLNTIADELDRQQGDRLDSEAIWFHEVARWLRAQAEEE